VSSTAAGGSGPFIASLLPRLIAFVHNRIESYQIFIQDKVMHEEHAKTARCILPKDHNMGYHFFFKLRKFDHYEVLL